LEIARPYLLATGDLLFARSGATVGKAFLYDAERHDYPACFAGYLVRARIDASMALPSFAYYWTQTLRYWDEIGLALVQATIQNVSAQRYGNLPFPNASLTAQREAVGRLDASDKALKRLWSTMAEQVERLNERRDTLITACTTGQLDPAFYREAAPAA
jgi:type I restriction enzyme S subunit